MRRIFIFLFILFSHSVFAQPFIDIAGFNYQRGFPLKNSDANHLTTHFNQTFLNVPLKLDSDFIVLNPMYENLNVRLNESQFTLHSVSLPVSLLHQWKNQKWKTAFVFIPRMMSDKENAFKNDSYQWGGAVLMIYKKKPTFKYKFGVYYNSEFFGPFILPLLGIDWNVDNKLNIFGVLPGSMNIEYKLNPGKLHIGASFKSITNSCRWKENKFIRINDNHLKFFADIYIFKKHVISLEAGHSVFRKYQNGIRMNGENNMIDFNVPDGFLVKAGYSFRIRTDN